ncbi:MAG: AIR synthase [Clostridiales bacterium]|nr:AIR synthase [Clostridiales bacterium]
MKLGKLTSEELGRIVLSALVPRRDDVVLRPGIGIDCGGVKVGDAACVLSTDPITAADRDAGWLAVHISCNDVAAAGAEPAGVLLTVLAPPDTRPEDVRRVIEDAQTAAAEVGVEIIGGHTEVTDAVRRMVLSATVMGKAPLGRVFSAAGARAGDAIVMTKWAAIEGTMILAADYRHLIAGALIPEDEETLRGLRGMLSVVPEGRAAAELAVTAMHDITEGGVLGALWEMARASGCGACVDAERIPVLPCTRRICDRLGLDPFRLISSGSLLIAAPDGREIVDELGARGISAAVIGRMTDREITIRRGNEVLPVEPPGSDELYRVIG